MPGGISNASSSDSISILNAHKVLQSQTILYKKGSANNGTDTIHTVTAGKTFYLLAAGMTANASLDLKDFLLYNHVNTKLILALESRVDATPIYADSVTINFPLAVPIAAGQNIICSAQDAGSTCTAWIIGWEE